MAKSFKSKSNFSTNSKSNNLTKKYTCGCGKKYTSYPAFSTHRKTKHNNQDVQGSYIPKFENPKRGRPSYEFVRKTQGKMRKINSYYQGLTVIELGLLKLNQLFQGRIISQSHQSNKFTLPDELIRMATHDSDKTKGENLTEDISFLKERITNNINHSRVLFLGRLLIVFVQLMTTHMNQSPAKALIEFMNEFIIYVGSVQKDQMDFEDLQDQQRYVDQENEHNSDSQIRDDPHNDKIEVSIFNEYFSRQENKEHINKLSSQYGLRQEFFVTACVILSHWMYKLGYCDKVIKIRLPSVSSKGQTY